jgi:hypothetical protein
MRIDDSGWQGDDCWAAMEMERHAEETGCSRRSWSMLFEGFLAYFNNPVSEFPLTYHSELINEDLASGEKR